MRSVTSEAFAEQLRADATDVCSPAELLHRVHSATGIPRRRRSTWVGALAMSALVVAIAVLGSTLIVHDRQSAASSSVYQGPISRRTYFSVAEVVAFRPGSRPPAVSWQQIYDHCAQCGPHGRMKIYLASTTRSGHHYPLVYITVIRNSPCDPPIGGPYIPGRRPQRISPAPQQGCTTEGVYSALTGKFILLANG